MVESHASTSPGRAPTMCSAIRSPVRSGASIHSGQPPTSRSPHSAAIAASRSRVRDRQAAERVAVEVDAAAGRRRTKRSRKARSGSAASAASAAARLSGSMPPPPPTAGCRGRGGRSGPRPARARARRRRPRRAPRRRTRSLIVRRHDVVAAAVREQRRHAERQPLGGRGRGVAVGHRLRRRRRAARGTTPRESPSSAAQPQVDDAGLRDDGRHRHAGALARREPGREVPARGVADARAGRRRASSVHAGCAARRPRAARGPEVGEVVDGGGHVVERLREAAARAAPEAAVLDVPRRPAARGEVRAQRVHLLAAVARAPEAAVQQDGDGVRSVAVRQVQLGVLRAGRAVGMALRRRHPATAPPRRAA